jgi:hypothetical protein
LVGAVAVGIVLTLDTLADQAGVVVPVAVPADQAHQGREIMEALAADMMDQTITVVAVGAEPVRQDLHM